MLCYTQPVMLRAPQCRETDWVGAAACAISERLICSLFASSSLFRMLSPIIPAHPRNAPVSPIIPALTQKRGVGVGYRNGNVPKYVGAPTFCVLHESHKRQNPVASEGGLHADFQTHFPSPRNILGGGSVLWDRGALGCPPRRGCSERGALC